jgi:hypothetical protein
MSQTKFNRDMRVDREFVDAHSDVEPLLVNETVEKWFWRYDGAAVLWKKIYEVVGTLSLVCVSFATLYLGYRVTLAPIYGALPQLDAAGTIMGGVGLVAQLTLVFARLRDRWLLARFAAERLRCLKYQCFRALFEGGAADELEDAIEANSKQGIASIRQELRAGRSAIGAFSPADCLAPMTASRTGDDALLRQAMNAYDKLRIGVQVEHFEDRIDNARQKEQSPSAVSDWFFVAASVLTLVELSLNGANMLLPQFGFGEIPPDIQPFWWFSVWTLFVVSAVLAIYGQARVQRVDADRYGQYRDEIADVRRQNVGDWSSFAARVYAMELVALRELQDFCRDQKYFGYLF